MHVARAYFPDLDHRWNLSVCDWGIDLLVTPIGYQSFSTARRYPPPIGKCDLPDTACVIHRAFNCTDLDPQCGDPVS